MFLLHYHFPFNRIVHSPLKYFGKFVSFALGFTFVFHFFIFTTFFFSSSLGTRLWRSLLISLQIHSLFHLIITLDLDSARCKGPDGAVGVVEVERLPS